MQNDEIRYIARSQQQQQQQNRSESVWKSVMDVGSAEGAVKWKCRVAAGSSFSLMFFCSYYREYFFASRMTVDSRFNLIRQEPPPYRPNIASIQLRGEEVVNFAVVLCHKIRFR
jgi:hypothetical protein